MISTDEDLLQAGAALVRMRSDPEARERAERVFRSSLEINQQNWAAAHNLGQLLNMGNRSIEAIPYLESATTINPTSGECWTTLATAYGKVNRFQEAYKCARKAVDLAPQVPQLWYQLAGHCERSGYYSDAISYYEEALKLAPDDIEAKYALGMIKMLLGDYEGGLSLYEARLKSPKVQARPVWDFTCYTSVSPKELMIEYEQGVGDLFQMIRYAEPLSKAFSCKVSLRCPSGVASIMRKVIGLHEVLIDTQEPRDQPGRCHVSMMSLPYLAMRLGLDIFQPPAKLMPSVKTVGIYPRIGLCWKGNPGHPKDRFRSIPLEKMLMVQPTHQVDLCSLQYGEDNNELVKKTMRTGLAGDWIKTAREMTSMDVVVTVDTAIAHLAGTLGKKTLLLISADPDWRWGLEGKQIPSGIEGRVWDGLSPAMRGALAHSNRWYPSIEVIRQKKLGEWDDAINAAARRVIELTREEV